MKKHLQRTRGFSILALLRRAKPVRILGRIVLVLVVGFAGGAIGGVAGMSYCGNYAVDFEFAGNQGYEAGIALGGLIGFVVSGALMSTLLYLLARRKQR